MRGGEHSFGDRACAGLELGLELASGIEVPAFGFRQGTTGSLVPDCTCRNAVSGASGNGARRKSVFFFGGPWLNYAAWYSTYRWARERREELLE